MMSRFDFLRNSAFMADSLVLNKTQTQQKMTSSEPIKIIATGYGPLTTSSNLAIRHMGERVEAKFPGEVEFHYVFNILELGYTGLDILWLVENGIAALGYQSSSYLNSRVPDLGILDLPFLFADNQTARKLIDGALGARLTSSIEANTDYKILGYFEEGFRHISNRIRTVRSPSDLKGLSIRVSQSEIHRRSFELLGTKPKMMGLSETISRVKAVMIDAQENPYTKTLTYGVHNFHKFHTATKHFYISQPIFFHRPTFESWPVELQVEIQTAVNDAVSFQRRLKDKEQLGATQQIQASGGQIVELTTQEKALFINSVKPIYAEVRDKYSSELYQLAGVQF